MCGTGPNRTALRVCKSVLKGTRGGIDNPGHYGSARHTHRLNRCKFGNMGNPDHKGQDCPLKFCNMDNPDPKGPQCPLYQRWPATVGPLHDLGQVLLTTMLPYITDAVSQISNLGVDRMSKDQLHHFLDQLKRMALGNMWLDGSNQYTND